MKSHVKACDLKPGITIKHTIGKLVVESIKRVRDTTRSSKEVEVAARIKYTNLKVSLIETGSTHFMIDESMYSS